MNDNWNSIAFDCQEKFAINEIVRNKKSQNILKENTFILWLNVE
jgi:hypothetical protein